MPWPRRLHRLCLHNLRRSTLAVKSAAKSFPAPRFAVIFPAHSGIAGIAQSHIEHRARSNVVQWPPEKHVAKATIALRPQNAASRTAGPPGNLLSPRVDAPARAVSSLPLSPRRACFLPGSLMSLFRRRISHEVNLRAGCRPTPREIKSPPFCTLIGSAMDNSSMDIHHSALIAINIHLML